MESEIIEAMPYNNTRLNARMFFIHVSRQIRFTKARTKIRAKIPSKSQK